MSEKKIAKIKVDSNLCIGAASCVIAAGTVFELNGDNKAEIKQRGGVKNYGPAEKGVLEDKSVTDDALLLAAQSCPTKAIILYAEDGGQIYP